MNNTFTIVNVAINRPLFSTFAYRINRIIDDSFVGARVMVNFANQEQIGIITQVNPETDIDVSRLKEAVPVDTNSIIPHDIFALLEFGSSYYQYPFGQCLNATLPKLLRNGAPFDYEQIPALELIPSVDEPTFEKFIGKIKSKEQLDIIEILKKGPVKRKELRERGFSSSSENALIKKGLVKLFSMKTENIRFTCRQGDILSEVPPEANTEQSDAILRISKEKHFATFLLNGITGSGKTEVYLRIIENVIKEGKAVLILVPEIALTPQTFARFYRRFSIPVSSMHSALSDRERLDAYIDMASGKSGILIGTRTALFTPIPNLGLIVVDEEHDSSFKQNDSFRYHARTMAIMRAKINDCPIVLGSATPSLESIYNAQRGIFRRIDLKTRAGGASLPSFSLIDLKNEPLTDGLKTGISQSLENEIGEETAKGNQVLLFLNRRGYAHHLVCHHCGHVFVCPNCDNLLTVHKKQNRLQCHVCENFYPIPQRCYVCENTELMEQGFGTEQVAEFLKLRYPDVGVERIDRDSVTTKSQLEYGLSRIRSGSSKIMLGTQMLAKGHDFPDVTLVGIIDVDSSLFSDDFRSLENTAQLLTQVSGRAGRGKKAGRVIIQTHHTDSLLINRLIDPDCSYIEIAEKLLEERRNLNLPPYSSQAFLLCNSTNRARAFNYLTEVNKKLIKIINSNANISVTRVMSDKMEKVQNRYHFHVLLTASDRKTLSSVLLEVRKITESEHLPSDVRFAIEVDPITMY
ncbi:MAG: primosomal protein N' [Succinivibrio sp.]